MCEGQANISISSVAHWLIDCAVRCIIIQWEAAAWFDCRSNQRPPICLSFSHNCPSIYFAPCCCSLCRLLWPHLALLRGSWRLLFGSTSSTEDWSGALMTLARLLVWKHQRPGTGAGRGLISWQHASNWVRTMSGPWFWLYRDWITMSGDSLREGRRRGRGEEEEEGKYGNNEVGGWGWQGSSLICQKAVRTGRKWWLKCVSIATIEGCYTVCDFVWWRWGLKSLKGT